MANKLNVQTVTTFTHSASGNLNGELPTGAMSTSSSGFTWAASTNQGMIDPLNLGIDNPLRIISAQLTMSGQDTWKIELVDGTTRLTLAKGTTETQYRYNGLALLSRSQKLCVTTTGASTTATKLVVTLVDPNFYTADAGSPNINPIDTNGRNSIALTGILGKSSTLKIAVSEDDASVSGVVGGTWYRVYSTVDAWIRTDAAAVTDAPSMPIAAKSPERMMFAQNGSTAEVHAISSSSGAVYLTPEDGV